MFFYGVKGVDEIKGVKDECLLVMTAHTSLTIGN